MVLYNQNIILVSEQPPDAQVHDLASLLNVDAKNIDVEKLGSDCIKEQQAHQSGEVIQRSGNYTGGPRTSYVIRGMCICISSDALNSRPNTHPHIN